MDDSTLTRRDLLKLTAFGTAAVTLPFISAPSAKQASELPANKLPKVYDRPFRAPRFVDLGPGRSSVVLEQKSARVDILGTGPTTRIFGYEEPGRAPTFPGPTLRVRQDQPITMTQNNLLPPTHPFLGYVPSTSTHLHGHPSFPQFDGYANDLTFPGFGKAYHYENNTAPRTLWYHDHGVHHTAQNVYMGMAAQYWLLPPEGQEPDVPQGEFELPLIISDAAFQANGDLLFDDRSTAGLMGDVILVNGVPWPKLAVKRRKYRFRVLDASIARGYRLQLSTGGPMTVIATDGGFVRTPQVVTELKVGMAERYEVVIDFAEYPAGTRVELRNLRVDNTVDFPNTDKVMAFDVVADSFDPAHNGPIPSPLGDPEVTHLDPAGARTRNLRFERKNGEWTINGHTWAEVEASNFTDVIADPALDAVEVWTLENRSGGWFHPIHVHLIDFLILDRNGAPPRAQERGPKDVVYLGENETIRFIGKFGPHPGKYMLHCHNADHEDHDMMFQMQVGQGGIDPLSARATPL
jgi:spore coat protein A, manganese oxidase